MLYPLNQRNLPSSDQYFNSVISSPLLSPECSPECFPKVFSESPSESSLHVPHMSSECSHVGKLYSASNFILSRSASYSWDGRTHGPPLQLDLNVPRLFQVLVHMLGGLMTIG
jgi:hypothetical protein